MYPFQFPKLPNNSFDVHFPYYFQLSDYSSPVSFYPMLLYSPFGFISITDNEEESRILQKPPPSKGGPEYRGDRPPVSRVIDWHARYPNDILLQGPRTRKEVALTFDDGPDNLWTPRILAALERAGVKGTFFLIGMRVQKFPHVFKRILHQGHVVGNHTWDHPKLSKLSNARVRWEITRAENEIKRRGGVRTRLFRPPYGNINDEIISLSRTMGFKIILWNVDSLDWSSIPTSQVESNILRNTRPGSIILMHSAGGAGEKLANTVEALPIIISTLRRQGYTFRTIPELLRIPAYY